MVIVSFLSCKQGHIPNTDMPELRNDTGVNISPSTPPVPPPPPAAPENLVKNVDFSKLTDDTSNYKDYWTDKKRPASWNTWASAKNIADVTFTATGGTFTVQAGNTVFAKGGIQQTITLESGVNYTLSVKVKLTKKTKLEDLHMELVKMAKMAREALGIPREVPCKHAEEK